MKKRLTGYIVYGILITIVFLYCRFPDRLIEQGIRSAVSKHSPEILVSLDSAALTFPLSVDIENLLVGAAGTPGLTIDHLKADIAFGRFLQGALSLNLEADAYDGTVAGDVGFANRFTTDGPITLHAKMDNIDIGKCPYLKTALKQDIAGRLTGSISYRGMMNDIINGTGDADITLLDGSIGLLQPLLGFDKLDFDTLAARIVLRDRALKIHNTEIAGKQLRGSFNGMVFLNNNILRSRIAAKGRVHMIPLEKDFSITFSGTLGRTRHRIR